MGYILPITQFEYINYQKRDIKRTGDQYYIEKPFKIKLDLQKQLEKKQNFSNELLKKGIQITTNKKALNTVGQDLTIAKITGKGSLFNEVI